MKTQIITIESHDDLISLRDRLSWAKTPRILLIWPRYEKISLRPLDLKVLQRHAESLGAQLGLVTRQRGVRREALALGIPVFASAAAAQRDRWPARRTRRFRPPQRPPRRDLRQRLQEARLQAGGRRASPLARLIAFGVGVLAVLTVAALFVPRAALVVYPEEQVQSVVLPILAGESLESSLLNGSVPSRARTIIVSGTQTLPVSGQITIPQAQARGVARFRNLTQNEVFLPAGTVVTTLNQPVVRFATLHAATLPAGVGQIVEVPIQALVPGASGNVDAGAIQAIEGPLGLSAAVSNLEPTAGGLERQAKGPTQADRQKLREMLTRRLLQQAAEKMQATLGEEDLFLPATLRVSQVLEETFVPASDQPAAVLSLTLRLECVAQVILAQDLLPLLTASLDAARPAGFLARPNTLSFRPLGDPVTDAQGVTRWRIEAKRLLLRQPDLTQVLNQMRGRSLQVAQAQLAAAFPFRRPAEIRLMPSWWPWLPLIPFRVEVQVQ
ncbi:MAG: baseplate J/gp47 family protein [Anaerolineae bacterium]